MKSYALGNDVGRLPGHMAGPIEAAIRNDSRGFLQHGPVKVLAAKGKVFKNPKLVPIYKGQTKR